MAPARGGVVDTVIPGETGALFIPGDADDLARQVIPLIEDDLLRTRLGRTARAAAEQRSWQAIFDRLFADYAEACAKRDGSVTAPPPEGVVTRGSLDA